MKGGNPISRKFNANSERLRGIKVKLYPSKEQREKLAIYFDLYRKVYNMAINIQEEDQSRYIKYYEMCKIFSELVKKEEYEWLAQLPISLIRQALVDNDTAYKMFFKKICRHPKFKSKKKSKKFFCTRSERTHAYENSIFITGVGEVYAKAHTIPTQTRLYNTSIHFDGYNYWFSCQVEKEKVDMSNIEKSDPIGVDVGLRNLITTSDGETFHFPKSVKKFEKRKKRQQRRLDKDYRKYLAESIRTTTKYEDIPKSKNHYKKLYALRKTFDKIRNIRSNTIHNATKRIVDKNPAAIVVEDIRVREITKQKWMKKYASEMPFFEIRRQLEYKAADRDIPFIVADAHYPSSKLCSKCGYLYSSFNTQETYICPICGNRMDRDINAALNLKKLAYTQERCLHL